MTLQPITRKGIWLQTADGAYFPYIGLSDFALFARDLMPNGRNALTLPRLDEWDAIKKDAGCDLPLVLRVFRYANLSNRFGVLPWTYDFARITELTQLCGERGYYIDWTCGDSQVVLPLKDGPHGQQEHLNQTCAALAGIPWGGFVQTCNEDFKNGQLAEVNRVVPPPSKAIDPSSPWGCYLRSSGAYYEDWQDWKATKGYTNLDLIDFHPSRDLGLARWPKAVYDLPVAASVLHMVFGIPVVMGEPLRFEEDTDPAWAARIGMLTAYCAGVTGHSQRGRDGDGFHDAPNQRAAVVEFLRGAVAGASITRARG